MSHGALQKKYYSAEREHSYLRYRAEDLYAKNLISYLLNFIDIRQQNRILEIGAGAGRFTIHLVKAGFSVTCVDISETQLRRLREDSKKAGAPVDRLEMHYMPVEDISIDILGDRFDVIIGFFILHHLDIDNLGTYFSRFQKLLKPNGRICFLEPNRLNPLFIFQYLFQRDIEFRYEMGTFRLSRRLLKKGLLSTEYKDVTFKNFGFFPSQIINRFAFVLKLERLFEKIPILNRLLPFLLVRAES